MLNNLSQEVMSISWNNLFRKIFIGLLLSFSIIFQSNLTEAQDLLSVLTLAEKKDPTYKRVWHEKRVSSESLNQAYAGFRPVVTFDMERIKTKQDIKSSDNEVFAEGETYFGTKGYTLLLTQPVFQYSSIVRLRQAKAEVKLSEVEYKLARQKLMLQIVTLYMDVLSANDSLTFAKAEESAAEKQNELATGKFEMGLVPITDLYDAIARLASVKAKKIESANSLDDALQALSEMTGEPVESFVKLNENFDMLLPDPAEAQFWTNAALEQNLAIKVQEFTVDVARNEIKRQKAGHYPSLDLVGRFNNKDTDGTLLGGGSEVDTREVLLRLTIPLYAGGSVNSKTRAAVELYQVEQQDLTKEKRAVKRQSRSAFLGAQSSINKTRALKQSITSQTSTLQAKQEGYKSGLYTSLAVLDAERDLFDAKKNYLKARYDYIVSSLTLKQTVGTLDSADIEMVNSWLDHAGGELNVAYLVR